ncbi:MAG: hypothetical protein NTY19_43745 [Planctomycetota bacterium]|nr:hypothetical protein [Planctomycetota bacterium]
MSLLLDTGDFRHSTGRESANGIMAETTLEERVAKLEQRVDELVRAGAFQPQTPAKDWRRTVGMFRGDPIMKEITDGALLLREEERQLAREKEASEQYPDLEAVQGSPPCVDGADTGSVLERIRRQRQASGICARTKEEIDAQIDALRDESEAELREVERIHEQIRKPTD